MTGIEGRLVVSGLRAGYGQMEAVVGVDLEVEPGEIVALVGRNGAGKTTSVLALAGMRFGRASGRVLVGDRDISTARPTEVVAAGLTLVAEGHRIFGTLSVRENLKLGAYLHRRAGRKALLESTEQVFTLFPILRTYASRNAGFLSGGEQQMVAIGQALMAQPKVLVLDEPTSGIAIPVIRTIMAALEDLRRGGMAILMVEQSLSRGLANSSRAYVMDQGKIVMSGASTDLAHDPRVSAIVRGTDEMGDVVD
jgi:branched-chain amino acid transport system ATP-binding protein